MPFFMERMHMICGRSIEIISDKSLQGLLVVIYAVKCKNNISIFKMRYYTANIMALIGLSYKPRDNSLMVKVNLISIRFEKSGWIGPRECVEKINFVIYTYTCMVVHCVI